MQIADYKIGIQFDIGQKQWRELDRQLKKIEKRLNKFSQNIRQKIVFNIDGFNVDQRRLNFALGSALDRASRTVVFEVSRFLVDQNALNRQLGSAVDRASVRARLRGYRTGGGSHEHHLAEGGVSGRHLVGAGGMGGLIARGWGPALALGAGGYGLGATNRRNQEVVSAQLQTQAVVQQAGGTGEQGGQVFDWLRSEADRVGFNYLEATNDFNNLTSGLTGAGMSIGQSQDVFKGFSELSRTNKLDTERQKRVYRALSQVAGKNQLMSEELKQQLAESLPGAVSLFAEAYQLQLADQGKGGGLVGADSIQDLNKAMERGDVKASILTYAGRVASQRANAGGALTAASRASQAEQNRFQNAYNDLAISASNAGLEEGFARIFRTLNSGAESGTSTVQSLARAFNDVTKYADDLLLFPAEFAATLNGKDGLIAEWLGKEETAQLRKDWQDIKNLVGDIIGFETPTWLPTLESTTREIATLLRGIAQFQQWLSNLKGSPQASENVSFVDRPITATYQNVSRLVSGTAGGIEAAKIRGQAVYGDPNSRYYNDPEGYDAAQRDKAAAAAYDLTVGRIPTEKNISFGDISITVPYNPMSDATPEEQGSMLADWFTARVQDTLTQYTEK